jgi:hypothetical protein
MLIVRTAQMAAFSTASEERFVSKMVKHHLEYFPEWSRSLRADALDAFIRHGMKRANLHGFETELEIARYLHVMQALGPNFDESGEYAWAEELLNRRMPPQMKMDRLRDAAGYELEARRIRDANRY